MGLQPQAGAKHVQGSHGKIGEGPGLQQLRDEDDDIRVQPEIRGERSAGVALENGGSDGKLCHGRTWPFVGEVSSGAGFGSSWPVPGPGENRSPRGPGSLPAAPAGGALTGPR